MARVPKISQVSAFSLGVLRLFLACAIVSLFHSSSNVDCFCFLLWLCFANVGLLSYAWSFHVFRTSTLYLFSIALRTYLVFAFFKSRETPNMNMNLPIDYSLHMLMSS